MTTLAGRTTPRIRARYNYPIAPGRNSSPAKSGALDSHLHRVQKRPAHPARASWRHAVTRNPLPNVTRGGKLMPVIYTSQAQIYSHQCIYPKSKNDTISNSFRLPVLQAKSLGFSHNLRHRNLEYTEIEGKTIASISTCPHPFISPA